MTRDHAENGSRAKRPVRRIPVNGQVSVRPRPHVKDWSHAAAALLTEIERPTAQKL